MIPLCKKKEETRKYTCICSLCQRNINQSLSDDLPAEGGWDRSGNDGRGGCHFSKYSFWYSSNISIQVNVSQLYEGSLETQKLRDVYIERETVKILYDIYWHMQLWRLANPKFVEYSFLTVSP